MAQDILILDVDAQQRGIGFYSMEDGSVEVKANDGTHEAKYQMSRASLTKLVQWAGYYLISTDQEEE